MILVTLVFVRLPAHGCVQRGKERSIHIEIHKNQPVNIIAVKIKGALVAADRKFAGDSDWFNGMTVTLKNVSDKPVVWATVEVFAYEEDDGKRRKTSDGRDMAVETELTYGAPPAMPGGPPRAYSATPLMPGQTTDLLLDERWRDQLYERLRHRNTSTDVPELNLSVWEVAFYGETDTMWMHGFWRRRDPNRPGAWLTVDEPTRLNHASRKPQSKKCSLPKL